MDVVDVGGWMDGASQGGRALREGRDHRGGLARGAPEPPGAGHAAAGGRGVGLRRGRRQRRVRRGGKQRHARSTNVLGTRWNYYLTVYTLLHVTALLGPCADCRVCAYACMHVLCVCMVRVRTAPPIFGTCVRASELWCNPKPIFEESPDGEHPFAPKRLQNLSLGKTRLNVHGSPKYFRGLARLQQGKSHDFTVEEPPGPFKV